MKKLPTAIVLSTLTILSVGTWASFANSADAERIADSNREHRQRHYRSNRGYRYRRPHFRSNRDYIYYIPKPAIKHYYSNPDSEYYIPSSETVPSSGDRLPLTVPPAVYPEPATIPPAVYPEPVTIPPATYPSIYE